MVSGSYGAGPGGRIYDEQSTNDNSYARAVIPLDNKGQINLSREGPVREFNSQSLRPNSNLSPIRGSGGQEINSAAALQIASGQHNVEMQVKLRQLEMNLLDYKSSIDRKIIQFNEDMPQQIKREVQSFELKE